VEVAMLLAASEGRHWRYEVCEHSDGYLVQMRDLETGDLDEDFSTICRTMPVAFAYAELSAALERHAAAELGTGDNESDVVETDIAASERAFVSLSHRPSDIGVNGISAKAWERERDRFSSRRLH
jgi:hypothetical protein